MGYGLTGKNGLQFVSALTRKKSSVVGLGIRYADIEHVPVPHQTVVISIVARGMIITMKNHVLLTHSGEHGVSGVNVQLRLARELRNDIEAASHLAVHLNQTVQQEQRNKNANVVASGPSGWTIGTHVNADNT